MAPTWSADACTLPGMVKRKDLRRHPRDYLPNPDDWPHGYLDSYNEPVVLLLQDICKKMHQEFQGTNDKGEEWTFRRIAEACRIDHKSVYDLWHGYSWGTLPVIASIEIYLRPKESIWTRAHIVAARHHPDIPQRGTSSPVR